VFAALAEASRPDRSGVALLRSSRSKATPPQVPALGASVFGDDQSCTDISDPFANMRMGLYTLRALHTDARVLEPRDVLRLHTLGSAEVLGVQDRVGSLEVCRYADFVVVDHRAPTTGPVWDVLATYVLACGLRNLKQVYVGGRPVEAALAARDDDELRERMARAAHMAGLDPAL
jgi:5-methylthioadenosine/S-adenosylhomocysteine deaminase